MDAEDITRLQEKIEIHKRRLHELELQAAKFGIQCPPHIKTEIEDIQEQIFHIERNIDKNVITSYIEGRETIKGVAYSLDGLEHNLRKVVIEEQRVYKIFGLPILTISRIVSQVLLATFILFFAGILVELLNQITTNPVSNQLGATTTALALQAQTAQSVDANVRATQEAFATQMAFATLAAIHQQQTSIAQAAAQTMIAQTQAAQPNPTLTAAAVVQTQIAQTQTAIASITPVVQTQIAQTQTAIAQMPTATPTP